MEASRQFSRNTVGDYATIYQGNITRTTNIVNAAHSNADDTFLREISKTNPIDDKERILASKGPLLYESFCWILEHERFTRWRNTRGSGVLWIKGDPGKGKTMLLCGIVENFGKDYNLRGKFAYFFCQGTDNRINTATAVIRGLIYSFLHQYPELLSHIREQNEKEPAGHLEGPNEWFALCRNFKSIIKDPCITDPICVIDALDECQREKSLNLLLDLIVDTSSHVRWLLSSRHDEEVEHGLNAIEAHQRLILELKGNSEQISKAVDIYIDRCVQDIKALKNDADLRIKTMNSLKAKANGTFLWVTLVVQQLRNTRRPHIETALQKMPEGLQNLYNEIMKRAKKGWGEDENACLVLLATVTAAERPLRLDELYMFISSQLSDLEVTYNADDVTDLAKACGSFISIKDDTIYFIHQSVKDYMIRNADMSILPLGIEHQHYRMFEISLSEMDKTLERNIYSIESPGDHIYDITPPDPNPLTPREYCCLFWVEHLVHCCQPQQLHYRECLKDTGILQSFLQKKYLYWLEAMVLLESIPLAVIALQKLQDLIANLCVIAIDDDPILELPEPQKAYKEIKGLGRLLEGKLRKIGSSKSWSNIYSIKQETNQIFELTRDVYRLVSEHRDTIEEFPIQIYASALIFCPTESILRKTFEETQCPEWIITKPMVRPDWSACIHTIEGHEDDVESVVFSPDNMKLASGSRDGTAKIWDLTTGACLQIFKSSNSLGMIAVSFSPNGNQLALVTYESIEIWDLTTSACIKTIQAEVESAAFIADGACLSTVSHDTIKIHDLATNIGLQTYRSLPGEQFHGAVFLSHSTQFATAVNNGTIETWGPETSTRVPGFTQQVFGAQLVAISEQGDSRLKVIDLTLDLTTGKHTQKDRRSYVCNTRSLILSPDGKRLASLTKMVTVWDIATKCEKILVHPEWSVGAIAFSHDGMRLASAGNTINIWDLDTGGCLRTFEGHRSTVHSLAFSCDGLWLASGAMDRTIRVWDLAVSKPLRKPEGHRRLIDEMKYSPDGRWLASLSYGAVMIWDPATGVCLRTFRSSSSDALVFSPDSTQLAVIDSPFTVKLWDLTTGACLKTLQCQESHFFSMAFSPNGNKLAFSGWLKTDWESTTVIEIWDAIAGECLHKIETGYFQDDIVFSPNGTQLWSISLAGNVNVYDPSTGKCLQSLEECAEQASASIERSDPIYRAKLHAKRLQQIRDCFSEEQGFVCSNKASELDISDDRAWILREQEPVLRLPPEYRPRAFAEHKNFCAIGTSSGQVLCFQFSFESLVMG